MPQIEVENLRKYYRVHQKEPGFVGSVRAFFNRQFSTVKAVDDISFTIEEGEMVGFLGPNGAGKTTTLKVLSGLLFPTDGRATVMGYTPQHRPYEYLRQMTLVMGNKNQLIWDLPASETFALNKAIYEIPDAEYKETLDQFEGLLNLAPLLNKQVRKLSLGERMKCELAAALLHRPKVLFLDEPTLGLDVTMQVAIRDFIIEYNRLYKATVILTSHYMGDVSALTERIIVINQGRRLYDGDLTALVEQVAPFKLLSLSLRESTSAEHLGRFGSVVKLDGHKAVLQVPRGRATETASKILAEIKADDLLIEDPPVEDIIRQVFADGTGSVEEVA